MAEFISLVGEIRNKAKQQFMRLWLDLEEGIQRYNLPINGWLTLLNDDWKKKTHIHFKEREKSILEQIWIGFQTTSIPNLNVTKYVFGSGLWQKS